MWTEHATGGCVVGLSVGATAFAATGSGLPSAVRPAAVTLQGQRFGGVVDRVGDPVPLVAADGSTHRAEVLVAQAVPELTDSVTHGAPASAVAVTVPAHWRPSAVDALRRELPGCTLVSDADAAVAALNDQPGLPTRGVVVLCDFGGSGSSITLLNASARHSVVGETVRYADFSGEQIDQALLRHVAADTARAADTAMVGSLTRLRDECRGAKERLSAETATAVGGVRVTRHDLDDLIREPFTGFMSALDDTLLRYGVPYAAVAAVATIGGGARIPLVTQLLSDHLRAPVVTTVDPHLTAARGAALLAGRVVEPATTVAPTVAPVVTAAAPSVAPLAWSQAEPQFEPELPYAPIHDHHRPEIHFRHEDLPPAEAAPARRSPLVLFGLSAAAVLTTAVFGLMQLSEDTATPVEAATTIAPSPTPAAPASDLPVPAPQAPQATTVVVQRSAPVAKQGPRQAPVTRAPLPAVPPPPPAASATPPPTTAPSTPPSEPPSTPESTPPSTPPSSPPSEPPSSPPSEPPSTPPSTPDTPPADPEPVDPQPDPAAEPEPPVADPGNPTETPDP